MQPKNYTLDAIEPVVDELYELFKTADIMTFSGPLGAGKTTLVQHLLRRCGVTGVIVSPTFSYVHTYRVDGQLFHHFDLYRLQSMDDFVQAGFDEYLYQPGAQVLIEWPEIIEPLLGKSVCRVGIEYLEENVRSVSVDCVD
jgi:tRNA threonylcarbamoyladenosine biosynthesis protein TsaE